MDAADLADDDWVGTVANMGAPLVGQERLTDSLTLARAVSVMESHIGQRFAALMSMEIGGANGVRPLMAAAHLEAAGGRFRHDGPRLSRGADDLGRGRRPGALSADSLVDVRGFESIVHKVPTWKWAERVARKICVEYGSVAATCQPPRTGAEVKQWGIHGTTTKAMAIGPPCARRSAGTTIPIAAILSVEPGKLLYKGKVIDVARRATEGFLRGVVRFDGLDDWRGSAMTINFQNEWIVALARRRAARHDARPDLRAQLGVGRGGRQRDHPLRPARHGDRPAAARRSSSRRRASSMSARAPSATTSISGACFHA